MERETFRAIPEGPATEAEAYEPEVGEDETDKEVFERYIRDLQLTPEDLRKKILDVGSYDSRFAKYAGERGISKEIYGLEPRYWDKSQEHRKTAAGFVENIPFRDGSFDLVVSLCAIPNIFSTDPRQEEKLRKSILEMSRILKDDGEIRLGRVIKNSPHDFHRKFFELLEKTLGGIAAEKNLSVEQVVLPPLTDKRYEDVLIKIRKKPA